MTDFFFFFNKCSQNMIQVFHAMLLYILILFKCWELLLVSSSTDWKLFPVLFSVVCWLLLPESCIHV